MTVDTDEKFCLLDVCACRTGIIDSTVAIASVTVLKAAGFDVVLFCFQVQKN